MAEQNKQDSSTPAKLITVTEEQLRKMIQEGALEVMASLKEVDEHKVADIDYDKLGAAIGQAVSDGMAKNQRPKVSPGQYVRRPYSVYHTGGVGDHKREKLARDYFINGHLEQESTLNDAEIGLLNRLRHPGRYIDRMVEVIFRPNGSEDAIEIRFSNKLENYMPLHAKCPTLEKLLQTIVDVQEIEAEEYRLQDEQRQDLKRRAHFNTQASREAREKVSAKA